MRWRWRGPPGSGKTHLALAWALEVGARQIAPNASADDAAEIYRESGGRAFIDAADQDRDEAMLWRVLDLARAEAGALLLVGSAPPAAWTTTIPDLRSRLAALPVAWLGEPDEALMEVILRRICREQFILLSDDAARYLARRLPRTFAAARLAAAALDADLPRAARPRRAESGQTGVGKAKPGSGRPEPAEGGRWLINGKPRRKTRAKPRKARAGAVAAAATLH